MHLRDPDPLPDLALREFLFEAHAYDRLLSLGEQGQERVDVQRAIHIGVAGVVAPEELAD
jgi:hypothetical protein